VLKLYTYSRSSAAYRVRIALNLKGLDYEAVPVHLLRDGGEHHQPDYASVNPSELVPTLEDGPQTITQSLAILEYLEETHPTPALLPRSASDRARVRALALTIACEIHPLNNLRVLQFLTGTVGINDAQRNEWYKHWVRTGFTAVERQLTRHPLAGRFCHGDSPTFADCCLVPQVFNARRFNCPLDDYPTLLGIHENCERLEAFQRAAPGMQSDAE
jgi:maleylacetoacetate isomerase/maleylpyruvate isomerase